MKKILFTLALAGALTAPLYAQDAAPLPLEKAVDLLVAYPKTDEPATGATLDALKVVSDAVATPDKLPPDVKTRLDVLLAERQPTPSPTNQIKLNDPLDLALVRYENRLLDATPPEKITAYRGAAEFPGAVAPDAVPISKTFEINANMPGRHSLGLYAAPGAHITVTMEGTPAQIKARGFSVLIGSHSDVLYNAPGGRKSAQRLPNLIRSFPLETPTTLAANPAGGLVYIVTKNGTIPGKLPLDHNDNPVVDPVKVTVAGAVASPFFFNGETSLADWKTQIANAKTPWAEVGSPWLILTMPIADAKKIADPGKLMDDWSAIARHNYELIGYPANHIPWRPERIVADVQISAGGAHAGYPIMMPRSWAARFSDPQQLRTGNNWGLYHELGHDFQNPNWSFAYNGEVTCNVFVFLARKNFGEPMWDDKNLAEVRAKLKEHLAKGENPWETGDNFSRLLFWYDMVNELGFAPLQTAFGETLRAPAPADETAERLALMTRLSLASGKNLGPYFEKWGVLAPGQVPADVAKLPVWLPVSFG